MQEGKIQWHPAFKSEKALAIFSEGTMSLSTKRRMLFEKEAVATQLMR